MEKEKVLFFRKNDIIIVLVLLLLSAAGLFVFRMTHNGEGKKARVTVDGVLFGEFELEENGDREQRIEIPGRTGICVLVIKDGEADMESAECPNQICVRHASISKKGETIVCLPNRVIVEII